MSNPLPLTVNLKWRETASSFTSRLAARNGLSASELCADFGVSFRAVLDGHMDAVRKISALGGVQERDLISWTPVSIGNRQISFRGYVFHSKTLRNPVMRGCPTCLREDAEESNLPTAQTMALRGHWQLPHLFHCLKHQQRLVALYRDADVNKRYDNAGHIVAITTLFQNAQQDDTGEHHSKFEAWLEDRLLAGPSLDWLSGQPLHAASVFCRLLGIALLRLEGLKLDDISESYEYSLYERGFKAAHSGELAIRHALVSLHKLVETPQDGPKKIYPALYERLSNDLIDNPDYAEFRRILYEHLRETWPLGPGDELLGATIRERRLHSVTTASRETGIDPRRLRNLLIAAELLPKECDLPDSWATFEANKAASILQELTTFIPATEFRKIIGATRSQFDLLVEDGVLVPALDTSKTKSVWDPRSGTAFIGQILRDSVQLNQIQNRWEHISKAAQRLKIRPGKIIRAIQNGQLLQVGKLGHRNGYAAIYVNFVEASQLFGSDTPPGHSIELFAKTVGASSPAGLRRFILDGHSPATRAINPRTRAEQFYITTADEDAFHKKYFTPRTMAKAYRRSWQSLRAELDRHDLAPIKVVDREYGRIFLRSRIEKHLGRASIHDG